MYNRSNKTPAIYAGYRQFFVFCRIAGCCLVNGTFIRHGCSDLKIKIWSWYILYSLAGLWFYFWAMAVVIGSESNRPIFDTPNMIFYGYNALLNIQAAISMLSLLRHSGTYLEIIKTCGDLEVAIGLPREQAQKKLEKISRRCLIFMILDSARGLAINKRVLPLSLKFMWSLHDWVKIGLLVCFEVGVYLVGIWASLSFWLVVYNASVLKEYFACVNARMVQALQDPTGPAESLQRVRLNHAALRGMVLKINNAFDLQVTLYYGISIYFLCASLYGVLLFTLTYADRAIRAIYVVCLATSVYVSARAAHNMTSEVS
ncbi:unnamed protein product, partial [Ixodes persulcatus]